jgi:ABC-2 type transport system ATP-binding protein
VQVSDPTAGLAALFESLRARGVDVLGVALHEPSLDDVFLHQTGRSLRDAGDPAATGAGS